MKTFRKITALLFCLVFIMTLAPGIIHEAHTEQRNVPKEPTPDDFIIILYGEDTNSGSQGTIDLGTPNIVPDPIPTPAHNPTPEPEGSSFSGGIDLGTPQIEPTPKATPAHNPTPEPENSNSFGGIDLGTPRIETTPVPTPAHNPVRTPELEETDPPVCQHTKTRLKKFAGYPIIQPYSDAQHVVEIQYKRVCTNCNKVVEKNVKSAREYYHEAHSFNRKGVCTQCGYTKLQSHNLITHTETNVSIVNETYHCITTTTYEECTDSGCGYKTTPVVTTMDEVHTIVGTNYEAEHPHKLFNVCGVCKAHPIIEGEFKTPNGIVLEKDKCCICNGHNWDTSASENQNGKVVHICKNCKIVSEEHTLDGEGKCTICGQRVNSFEALSNEKNYKPTVITSETHNWNEIGKIRYVEQWDHGPLKLVTEEVNGQTKVIDKYVQFNNETYQSYWGTAQTGHWGNQIPMSLCTRAAASMAFSYLGKDVLPKDIPDEWGSFYKTAYNAAGCTVDGVINIGAQNITSEQFMKWYNEYATDANCKHSPVCIRTQYKRNSDGSIRGHAFIIVGHNEKSDTFYIVDPGTGDFINEIKLQDVGGELRIAQYKGAVKKTYGIDYKVTHLWRYVAND